MAIKPITIEIDDPEQEGWTVEIDLPTKWAICDTCRGNGSHSLRFGAITAEDRERDWDDESFESYMRGDYDEPCGDCEGGKRRVVDVDQLTPEQLAHWQRHERAVADARAEEIAERRYFGERDY